MAEDISIEQLLSQQKKAKFPTRDCSNAGHVVDKPFDAPGWIYEVKWDGYRAIAFIRKGKRGIVFTECKIVQ